MSPTAVTLPTPLRVARAIALVQGSVAALSVLLMLGLALIVAGGLKNGAFVAFALLFLAGDVLAVSAAVIMAARRLADAAGWARLLLDVFEGVTAAVGLTTIPLGWSPVGAVMIAAGVTVILCLHLPSSKAVFAGASLLPLPEELDEPSLPIPSVSLPPRRLPAWPRPDPSPRVASPGTGATVGVSVPSVPTTPSSRPAPAFPALSRPADAVSATPPALSGSAAARRPLGPAIAPAAFAGAGIAPAASPGPAVPAPPSRAAQPPAIAPPAASPAAPPRWSPGLPAPPWVASDASAPSSPALLRGAREEAEAPPREVPPRLTPDAAPRSPALPPPERPASPALPSPAARPAPARPLRPMIPPRPPRSAHRRSHAPGLVPAVSTAAAVPRRVRAAAASARASLERALPVAPTWGWRRVVVGASVLGAVAGGAASAVGLLTEGPQLPSTGASPLAPPPPPAGAAHGAPAPPPAAPPVERIEPASAGGIAGVAIQSVWCSAGGGCPITVRVDLQPPHPDEVVSWILVVTDRCSGQRVQTVVPGIPAPASYRFVLSTNQVTIPAWRAPELVAITTGPARAESAPVAIGGPAAC